MNRHASFIIRTAFAISAGACLSQAVKSGAADTAYAAEQIKCVDTQPTKAQIDVCRENVRRQWNAVRDAGLDVNAEGGDQ